MSVPSPERDLDLRAHWLEMSEALAYQDAYAAAAALPGNPTGAASMSVGGGVAFGLTAIEFGFFNRVVGLGAVQPPSEDDVEGCVAVLS